MIIRRRIRDLLAAGRLEAASYELLARAAGRADDPDTASLARKLRDRESQTTQRIEEQLDSALEVALLAE